MIIEDFRSRFKSIVYVKGEITDSTNYLKRVSHWDKNGSHAKAIQKAQDEREDLRRKLQEKCGNLSYEQWLEISRKLSGLNSRHRQLLSKAAEVEMKINTLLDEVEEKSLIPSP